jgi:CheY-like chemotaxis protein
MRTVGRAQKTLLIVDDHARLRCAMSEILREAGFAVLETDNGAEGLRLAALHDPDGILLDLAMPGRSGLEVLKKLKHRNPEPRHPGVFCRRLRTGRPW